VILEEKRQIVRMLISKVLVVKTPKEPKKIIPKLALDIPPEYANLVYRDQSPDYNPASIGEFMARNLDE
jgi:hypothetical protein